MRLASLHRNNLPVEPIWHVMAAVGAAIILQLLLSDTLSFGSKFVIAGLEVLLMITLAIPQFSAVGKRLFAIVLLSLISVANIVSLSLVIQALFAKPVINGRQLLISSVAIYLTNIIVFGMWYWELDNTKEDVPDFLFPQLSNGPPLTSGWKPTFFDYLYVSVTNATAFSPTDTLPITHRAKLLMTVQSIISLVTVALVAARAVNILT